MFLNPVLTILGWSLTLLSALMVFPSLLALEDPNTPTAAAFFVSGMVTLFFGGALIFATRGEVALLARRETFLTATLSWVIIPAFAALPLFLSDAIPDPVDAYFEAISGFTTNGASVLQQMQDQSRAIFLWRALIEWYGGFSLIILVAILASAINIPGSNPLSRAIAKSTRRRMSRRVRFAVTSLISVYFILTTVCLTLLWASGMSAFEAICYALSTISTGGFTLPDQGSAIFSSRLTELVIIVFMAIGAFNFSLHWSFFNGDRKAYLQNPEYRYFIYIFVVIACLMVAMMTIETDIPFLGTLRYAIFNTVSALSTTGYTMSPVSESGDVFWPVGTLLLIFIGIIIGGSTGSTAGGIKLMRIVMLMKLVMTEVRRLSFPRAVVLLQYGNENITKENILATWAFFSFYCFSIIIVSLGLSLTGLDVQASLMLAVANLSSAGAAITPSMLGYGSDGVNFISYFDLSQSGKILLCFAMLVGRLEFFAVLALFNPALWRR
jgi:trk/ktr system potassium uptake protein